VIASLPGLERHGSNVTRSPRSDPAGGKPLGPQETRRDRNGMSLQTSAKA
jgi:hypothetical protein